MRLSRIISLSLQVISLLVFTGCSAVSQNSQDAAATHSYNWQVSVSEYQIKENLATEQVVTQYNGSKNEVTHTQTPASGNVYVVLNAKVSKTGSQSMVFHWSDLKLADASGTEYSRHSNDSFLEQHNFSPRMTGLDLRLGENEGWLVFEIPTSAANGDLKLVYRAEDGTQEIALNQ